MSATYSVDTDPRHPSQAVRIITAAQSEAEAMRAVREHLALHPDVMRVRVHKDEGRSHCSWKVTRKEVGALPLLQFQGRECHADYEWAGDRVSVRFGAPEAWQGEVVVDRSALRVVTD